METESVAHASEELIAHCTDDVVFEPHAAQGRKIVGREELRAFWEEFEQEGLQMRAGAYSIAEEGDTVVVDGWIRTIDAGRLADTQSRWIYRFDERDRVVSARAERA